MGRALISCVGMDRHTTEGIKKHSFCESAAAQPHSHLPRGRWQWAFDEHRSVMHAPLRLPRTQADW